jgi:hypothetical protein
VEALKQKLFTNWHPLRWVALGLGFVLGLNWLINSAPVSGILALFFLFQAVTNTGCLAGQCTIPDNEQYNKHTDFEDVQFQEIKDDK